jgi:hypothetical protein
VDEWLSRCAFNTEITGSIPVEGTNIGRPAYQCGQLSVKQPLIALQVQILPDLPKRWRDRHWQGKLSAKQLWDVHIPLTGSTPSLSALGTWCKWITSQITNLKSEGSNPSVLAIYGGYR